jgi:isoleucyl-tRNA synthetase
MIGGRKNLSSLREILIFTPFVRPSLTQNVYSATSQWFANLDFIKEDALTALKDVSFFPESCKCLLAYSLNLLIFSPRIARNRLEAFVRSRSEWCISRQRVWGVPIPALQHIATGRVVLDSPTLDYILNAMESKNLDWYQAPIEEFVPPWLLEDGKSAAETWEKGRDTMDVWFDSGSSWSMLAEMGVGRDRQGVPETGRKHDADLCLEGSDQHRGWFQSQLLTAIGSRDADEAPVSPYANLFTHGMVLDEKGKKMSKSLGNIISPMTIVHGSSVCLFLPLGFSVRFYLFMPIPVSG